MGTFQSICAKSELSETTTFPYSFDVPPRNFSQLLKMKPYDRLSVPLQREPLFAFLYAGPYEDQLPEKNKHFKANPISGDTPAKARFKFLKKHNVNVQLKNDKLEYKHTVLGSVRPSQAASQTSIYYTPELLTVLKKTEGGMKNIEIYLNYLALFILKKQGAPSVFTPDMLTPELPQQFADFLALFIFNKDDLQKLIEFSQGYQALWEDTLFKRAYGLDTEAFTQAVEDLYQSSE